MRILVHTIFYRPELTGVAKYTAEMCEWLCARGHQVEVICPPPYYPRWKVEAPYRQGRYQKESIDGVSVTRCPIWLPATPGGVRRIFYAASFAISSSLAIASRLFRGPDVVLVIEPSLLNAFPSLLLARLTGAVAWLHVQDFEIDLAFGMGQLRRPWLRNALRRLEAFLLRRFDKVSTISRAMETALFQKGVPADRAVLVPNWVDTEQIHPAACATPLRRELSIASDTIVVLFSGTLGAKQGVETALGAARRLLSHPNLEFVICGSGPAEDALKSLAQALPNVRFLPLQPAARLNDLLNLADIQLLTQIPGAADSVLPSKLLGMMASGRPIVATAHPQSELGGAIAKCGVAVPPGDAERLAEAIRDLAANPDLRATLGAEARREALRSFRHDVILSEFEKQLAQCVEFANPLADAT